MKKDLILVFVFLTVLGFGIQSVSAQFTIKIPKSPKITKIEVEKNKPNSKDISHQNSSNDSGKENPLQAKPSALGKIYFSNQPFGSTNSGGKTLFSTNEYIYGRFETGGKTLREVFGFAPISNENAEHKLFFNLYGYDPGVPSSYGDSNGHLVVGGSNGSSFITLTEADLDKTYWNFDVLPDPAKAATRIYWLVGDFKYESEKSGALALYNFLKNDGEEKNYVVRIELVKKTTDFRGQIEPEEKWLTAEGRLGLSFKGTDFPKIKSDQEKMEADRQARIKQSAEDSEQAKIENEPLPEAWTLKSSPLLPGLTESKLKAMFLQDHPDWVKKQIVKLYAEPANSTQPTIVKNDVGIPKYRYLRQSFVAFVKVVGENECFYQRFTPAQPYSGGGTYGSFYAILDNRVDISCEKMGIN